MLVGRSWGILERAGLIQEVPRRPQRHPRSRPKAPKHRPRSAPGRPKDPKGRGRSAPGSLGLALLGRRRAARLVSGAFAEIVVLRCKKLGLGGSGHLNWHKLSRSLPNFVQLCMKFEQSLHSFDPNLIVCGRLRTHRGQARRRDVGPRPVRGPFPIF